MSKLVDWIDKHAMPIALFILFLYLLPFIILGENSKMVVHDGLDGIHVWNTILAGKELNRDQNACIPYAQGGGFV